MFSIKYYLTDNPFNSPGEERLVARVKKDGILDQEDLIEAMIKKRALFPRQVLMGVFSLMRETIMEQILDGNSVYTDIFRVDTSIKGDFTNHDDRFDRDKHKVAVNFKAALDFQKDVRKRAKLKKIKNYRNSPNPVIMEIYRFKEKSFGKEMSPGDLVELRGHDLKHDKGVAEFFLSDGDNRYPMEVVREYEKTVLCYIPTDILPGSYRMLVARDEPLYRIVGEYPETVLISQAE
ncbi:MAG: DNA-binding domain-containing protein [Spirochaetales bacterium]|nr:DNA-binding domain-containing protein [Spirochaetales bacterium]